MKFLFQMNICEFYFVPFYFRWNGLIQRGNCTSCYNHGSYVKCKIIVIYIRTCKSLGFNFNHENIVFKNLFQFHFEESQPKQVASSTVRFGFHHGKVILKIQTNHRRLNHWTHPSHAYQRCSEFSYWHSSNILDSNLFVETILNRLLWIHFFNNFE